MRGLARQCLRGRLAWTALGTARVLATRDASRKDPTFGSRLPHIRIRPSSAAHEGALSSLEVELEPNGIDALCAAQVFYAGWDL
jgi:hypothetical protein